MKEKKAVMNKSTKPANAPAKPVDRQRGFGVVELLFVASTIGTALLVAASRGPKIPPGAGD